MVKVTRQPNLWGAARTNYATIFLLRVYMTALSVLAAMYSFNIVRRRAKATWKLHHTAMVNGASSA